jgi:hypothetical protein
MRPIMAMAASWAGLGGCPSRAGAELATVAFQGAGLATGLLWRGPMCALPNKPFTGRTDAAAAAIVQKWHVSPPLNRPTRRAIACLRCHVVLLLLSQCHRPLLVSHCALALRDRL